MKRIIALTIALMLLLCTFASAEIFELEKTHFTVNLPSGIEVFELSKEDKEDDMVASFGTEESSMEMCIYVYPNEDEWTVEELAEAFQEDEGVESCGTTNINGIDAAYEVFNEEDSVYINYYIVDGENLVEMLFYIGEEDVKTLSQEIMNSLQKK